MRSQSLGARLIYLLIFLSSQQAFAQGSIRVERVPRDDLTQIKLIYKVSENGDSKELEFEKVKSGDFTGILYNGEWIRDEGRQTRILSQLAEALRGPFDRYHVQQVLPELLPYWDRTESTRAPASQKLAH